MVFSLPQSIIVSLVLLSSIYLQLSFSSSFSLLSGVVLTTGKDTRVFEKSITSALKYLIDIDKFYVISPDADYLTEKLGKHYGKRVVFVNEAIFPFKYNNITDIMIQAVKDKGIYPLTGHSSFERTLGMKTGWFLQQLLKLYAGKVLGLNDFLLLDSDLIWYRNVTFYNNTNRHEILSFQNKVSIPPNNFVIRYNYASSGQYHPPYMATMKRIIDLYAYEDPKDVFRSGITHHMVIVKNVIEAMMSETEKAFGGTMPFWQIMLNQSAIEMTCKAPRDGICGSGSTLSEYEMYFTYARHKHPQTIAFRPILWANGPRPGLLFWPPLEFTRIHPDRAQTNWMHHRQPDGKKPNFYVIHLSHIYDSDESL